mgnify:CR=1 FL=1
MALLYAVMLLLFRKSDSSLSNFPISTLNRFSLLKGIDSSVDFISLREGDSMITRTNKNEIAKTYRGLAKDAEEELEKQVYAYNYYQAQPRQVAGTDVRVAPVTGNRENIV